MARLQISMEKWGMGGLPPILAIISVDKRSERDSKSMKVWVGGNSRPLHAVMLASAMVVFVRVCGD